MLISNLIRHCQADNPSNTDNLLKTIHQSLLNHDKTCDDKDKLYSYPIADAIIKKLTDKNSAVSVHNELPEYVLEKEKLKIDIKQRAGY